MWHVEILPEMIFSLRPVNLIVDDRNECLLYITWYHEFQISRGLTQIIWIGYFVWCAKDKTPESATEFKINRRKCKKVDQNKCIS